MTALTVAPPDETADEPPVTPSVRPMTPPFVLVGLSGALFFGVALAISWRVMKLDYFFDEMWRIDIIRSGDWMARARLQNAFVPAGWVVALRPLRPVFDSPFGWRLVDIGCLVIFLCSLVGALTAVAGPTGTSSQRRRAFLRAAGAMAVLPLLPAVSDLTSYFHDYFFQAAYMGVLVLLCVHLDDDRRFFPAACVALALSPVFVMAVCSRCRR